MFNDIDNDKLMLNDKLHTKRQQVHISMFCNLLQLTNSVAIGFSITTLLMFFIFNFAVRN
jgi:hypothetical protein